MIHKKYLLLLLIYPSILFGQLEINKHILGPSLGFSFLGSTLQYGVNHEFSIGLKQIGMAESGIIGIGGVFRYWQYSESFRDYDWDYTDVLIGLQTNYHFYISDDSIDPWFGIVIAYDFGDADITFINPNIGKFDKEYGGFFIGANAGLRYWITNNMAISSRLGIGSSSYAALEFGIDYKFNK